MCTEKNIVYIGFDTTCGFRHPQGSEKTSPTEKGRLLYVTSLNGFKILQWLFTTHKPKLFSMAQMDLYMWSSDIFHALLHLCIFTHFSLCLKIFSATPSSFISKPTYILSRWAQGERHTNIVVKSMGISVLKPRCESSTVSSCIPALSPPGSETRDTLLSFSETQCPL